MKLNKFTVHLVANMLTGFCLGSCIYELTQRDSVSAAIYAVGAAICLVAMAMTADE